MGYALSVSEVGPAEYPLMEVLRETLFREAGHVFQTTLAEDLEGRQDVFALIAHLEGNPVGFKIGYRFGPGVYYSKAGGVLKEYRRNGLARQMQTWQHGWARARGYRRVFFNSFNHFKEMIRFGLDTGFVPIGAEWQSVGALAFRFSRDLGIPDKAAQPVPGSIGIAHVHAEAVGSAQHGLVTAMAALSGTATEDEIEADMSAPATTTAMVFLSGKPVGFALGREVEDNVFRTTRFVVVDTYRGMGAEVALAHHQLNLARNLGCDRANWEAAHDDVMALRSALDSGYDFTGLRHDPASGRLTVLLDQRVAPTIR